jgi:hypothetical protein
MQGMRFKILRDTLSHSQERMPFQIGLTESCDTLCSSVNAPPIFRTRHCPIMSKSNSTGFWLDVIPGLLGLFGLGELYLGHKRRAEIFLIWTAGLYLSVLGAFTLPSLSYYWGYLPIAWGTGYLLLLVDIFRLTRKRPVATFR